MVAGSHKLDLYTPQESHTLEIPGDYHSFSTSGTDSGTFTTPTTIRVDAELLGLVRAWPGLTPAIRETIIATYLAADDTPLSPVTPPARSPRRRGRAVPRSYLQPIAVRPSDTPKQLPGDDPRRARVSVQLADCGCVIQADHRPGFRRGWTDA